MNTTIRALVGAGVSCAAMLVTASAMALPNFNFPPWNRDHGPTPVPEINGGGAPTAAAIVLGGAAVILSRRKRRHG